ncbi:hypothetical protein E0504_25380 [Parafrankia sp. BMG5.11]|nr:hypothetical protein E0504_25380 [Parafrankia sp. BMG5.11]
MPIMPSRRDRDEGRPLTHVSRTMTGLYELVIVPGATPDDLITASADLPVGAVFIHFYGDQHRSVLVFRPRPARDAAPAPATAPAGGWLPALPGVPGSDGPSAGRMPVGRGVAAWWTVRAGRAVDGPHRDQLDALISVRTRPGSSAAYGWLSPDGSLAARPAPEDLAWERLVSRMRARVVEEDRTPLVPERDRVSTLAARVADALTAVGLPLYDPHSPEPCGGVTLTPTRTGELPGVALGWVTHPHMAHGVIFGGGEADRPVVTMMAERTAEVLASMGFTLNRPADELGPPLVIGGP